ncbi:MAG: polymerase subunit gamma/tau, partial [Solirubrobacteraceae bacterium]|nr:polymerase subunit gamma/tau [Solirubrobacteraceae bacterium]
PPSAPPPSQPPARASARPEPSPAAHANGAAHTVTVEAPPAPPGAGPPLELDGLRAVWPAVIESVRSENALCAAVLAGAMPVAVDGERVTIAFPPTDDASFLRRKAEDDGYRRCVATALRTITGSRAQIAYVLGEPLDGEEGESVIVSPPTEDEWVRRFVAEFDAEEILPEPDSDPPDSESETR